MASEGGAGACEGGHRACEGSGLDERTREGGIIGGRHGREGIAGGASRHHPRRAIRALDAPYALSAALSTPSAALYAVPAPSPSATLDAPSTPSKACSRRPQPSIPFPCPRRALSALPVPSPPSQRPLRLLRT
ncbi:hypothetical protein DENSPDRAFT_886735, partial [Dentipellis sp. KUC8613]